MKVLVLYSWEENADYAQKWAMALCKELSDYESIDASCDMLFVPKSNIKKDLKEKILQADKILVVVTDSYNYKIEHKTGMVSYEEQIYKTVIKENKSNDKILFLLKSKNGSLPQNWNSYNRIDMSRFNATEFFEMTSEERKIIFENIIRFCISKPRYELQKKSKKKKLPTTKPVENFNQFFSSYYADIEPKKTIIQQEKDLIKHIKENLEQESFVDKYIKAGLSADLNLNDRLTPELFIKHFLVKGNPEKERQYNSIVKNVFSSNHHNMLCIQSDGGSGKSTFIHTLGYKDEHKINKNDIYNSIIIDLSNYIENLATKEDVLFQLLKKKYRQMSRNDEPGRDYYTKWRNNFVAKANKLKEVAFNGVRIFKLRNFQDKLNSFLDVIIPSSNIEDWYSGYSNRLTNAKEGEDVNILFVILLITYLLVLDSKPKPHNKKEHFTIVFDNIETYDNGETAKHIANYIESCHIFIRKVFTELGEIDNFYMKFTFVTVVRTSTLIHFGNTQSELWGAGKYIKHISFFDFSTEALLKKMIFLKRIKGYENSKLYKKLYLMLSIIMPQKQLNKCLENPEEYDPTYNHFTTHRLLPLFNNNFRRAMGYLSKSILSEDNYPMVSKKICEIENKSDVFYDFSIHGLRMKIFRDIFHEFQDNGYFKIMGFSSDLSTEDCSLTRMILAFLYWDELISLSNKNQNNYDGALLKDLIVKLSKYRNPCEVAKALYGLSLFANRLPEKKEALNAWGNLITYKSLNIDLDESDFQKLVDQYISNRTKTEIKIGNNTIDISEVRVKLSDAGMCFAQHYIRNFEFLVCRNSIEKNSSLFFVNKDMAMEQIDSIIKVLENCINRIITPSKDFCCLWRDEECNCDLDKSKLFSCNLFLRYQECIDLIRENIWYVDRYRVVYYIEFQDCEYNVDLVIKLNELYSLYGKIVENMMFDNKHTLLLSQFLKKWTYPNNTQYFDILSDEQKKLSRIDVMRPIQSYFSCQREDINKSLDFIKQNPKTTLYDALQNIYAKDV